MNVNYKDINTSDAARMLGVTLSCMSGWCKHGYVCAQDVSEKGSTRPRYRITEVEIARVKKLIKKYGKKAWRKHYMEGRDEPIIPIQVYDVEPEESYEVVLPEEENVEDAPIESFEEPVSIIDMVENNADKDNEETKEVEEIEEIEDDYLPTRKNFDADKVLDTVLKIQDFKKNLMDIENEYNELHERLSNLDAERNQIINEIKIMRNEIISII